MGTIEQAAKKSAKETIDKLFDKNGMATSFFIAGYKSCAEFTQRFILVEDELPLMNQELIVKYKNEQTGRSEFGTMSFIDSETSIKELCKYLKIEAWRPIFFK